MIKHYSLCKKEVHSDTTWMNFQIMLSKIHQSPKDECCIIPFCEASRRIRFIETGGGIQGPEGGGNMTECLVGTEFQLGKKKMF